MCGPGTNLWFTDSRAVRATSSDPPVVYRFEIPLGRNLYG